MPAMTTSTAISADQVARWLAAARETIARVRYCWVATRAEEGGANARAVRSFAGMPGADEWTRRFICRRGSRKVMEIRSDPRVTLAYQDDSGNAFVALGGRAVLIDDPSQIRDLWPESANPYFPAGFAEANMLVVNVQVDRIEVHARGITAEPFGHGRTLIERDAIGEWFFVPATA
jgi:general stress protein 26